MNFSEIKSIHFVGIGGIGMSGIAEILHGQGFSVSGCDLHRSAATDLLERLGITVHIGHDPAHLDGCDTVVYTAAIKPGNPEIEEAKRRGLQVVRRSEILGELVNAKRAVGVSGTHGKTTTTAMVAVILEEAGLDPTVLLGGMLRNFGANARAGLSSFLVVEADEYDRTFHHLHPEIAVVTNIEADHLEYYGNLEAIIEAFRIFVEGIRPGGAIIGCADDSNVAKLLDAVEADLKKAPVNPKPRIIRYGLSRRAVLRASRLRFLQRGSSFDIKGMRSFRLFVPGEHNVRNALAAIAVARELGIPPEVAASGLAKFLGVDRRFQILGEFGGALIIDDYAHHPTEIRATLDAARQGYPDRRIVALFQPHLYSRTRDFARQFAESLGKADVALVAPIYAARETPVEGITSRLIADAGKSVEFIDRSNQDIIQELRTRLKPNDIFITMGAGDVHEISEALVAGGGS